MSLENWLADGKLKLHQTSPQEIQDLFKVVERDMADASITAVSADRRFSTAYNAALQLATIALHIKGYRSVARAGHHAITIASLEYTLGPDMLARKAYLEVCRTTRHKTDYDRAGVTEEEEVQELLAEVKQFYQEMKDWLQQNHSNLTL